MDSAKQRYSQLSRREALEAVAVENRLHVVKQKQEVASQLRDSGLSPWAFTKPEARDLYKYVLEDEVIRGAVFGHSKDGNVLLAATDRRIIYFDKKPLFIKVEDISYDVLSGITLRWVLYSGTVVLHTRLGDIAIRTRNRKAAEIFKNFIDSKIQNNRVDERGGLPTNLRRLPLARSRV